MKTTQVKDITITPNIYEFIRQYQQEGGDGLKELLNELSEVIDFLMTKGRISCFNANEIITAVKHSENLCHLKNEFKNLLK